VASSKSSHKDKKKEGSTKKDSTHTDKDKFIPPEISSASSHHYKSFINAHPSRIENDSTTYMPQTHNNNAQVKILLEMLFCFAEETLQ
jgi:hypothetical protein